MFKKKWVFFIPVIIAIAILIVLKQNKKEPTRSQAKEQSTHVRVITIPSVSVAPKVYGYGTVQPTSNWKAIAQVRGKIIYKDAKLKKGNFLKAEQLLIKIDPTDYQLNIAQTQADIAAIEAQLSELVITEKNTRASILIEKDSLKLTKNELERLVKVAKKGGISSSEVEKQQRTYLAQKQIIQNQKNTLNLLPSKKALLDAQLTGLQTKIQTLQRDLANTQIILPFSGRVAEVNIEENQYIREGEVLTTIDALDKAEVEVQLPMGDMSAIMSSDINANASNKFLQDQGVKAQVELNLGNNKIYWSAHFSRLSDTLDPKTRTVGVIVEVDKPYSNIKPGIRPPLVKGLFVKVNLFGKIRENSLIVPNSAIHTINVESNISNSKKVLYLVNKQGRLEIKPIKIKTIQDEYSIIHTDSNNTSLKAGDTLIISQLLPAIENMLLTTEEDKLFSAYLIQQATADHD